MSAGGTERVEIPVGDFVFDALAAGPPDGELILLLHGFPQSSYEWRAPMGALAGAGYRAVAPDQRGYSPRARPDGAEHYRLASLAADVVAMADWLGGHRFHVVGHDWGAAVAWQVAGSQPERVRTLTAISVPHPMAMVEALAAASGAQLAMSSYIAFFQAPRLPETVLLGGDGARLRDLLTVTGLDDGEAVDRYVARLRQPGALTAALNWYRALDLSAAAVGPVTVPTMFVWGEGDPAIGREAAEGCARHVSGPYRFQVMAGAGHWIPEQQAVALNRMLLDHLASVEDPPGP
ncbi:MAG: alpha/beta fold hydrolase [Acidimicrobiales bacterium]